MTQIDTTNLFVDGNTNEFHVVLANLMENNRIQAKDIRNLKLEGESQDILLSEVTKQKKKSREDKAMIEEDKRILANQLEEKSTALTKISNMQLDTLSQMMNVNYELNVKDNEVTTLKFHNEKLQNELKRENKFFESLNKPNETIKYFEQLLDPPNPTMIH